MHSCQMFLKSRVSNSLYRLTSKTRKFYGNGSNITKVSRSRSADTEITSVRLLSTTNQLNVLNLNRRACQAVVASRRFYATDKKGSGDDDHHREEEDFNTQLPATVAVPEVWPHVPVIAINRNIVFPRFIKLIEVCLRRNFT